jgi:hypothetical protein
MLFRKDEEQERSSVHRYRSRSREREKGLRTSFFFCSSLSRRACLAFFSAKASRNSSNRCFFSSSVRGAISSVDSSKSTCSLRSRQPNLKFNTVLIYITYVFSAWNSACAILRNFLPQTLHFMDFATSPSFRAAGSMLASVSALVISSRDLSWFVSSHSRAPWTERD